jgi:hypothetical protein
MGHGAWGIGHWALGIGHGAWGIGHTSPRLRTAIDTRIFKEVWDLDLLFFYK